MSERRSWREVLQFEPLERVTRADVGRRFVDLMFAVARDRRVLRDELMWARAEALDELEKGAKGAIQ